MNGMKHTIRDVFLVATLVCIAIMFLGSSIIAQSRPDLKNKALGFLSEELNLPVAILEIRSERVEHLEYLGQDLHTFIIQNREALERRISDKPYYITLDSEGRRVNIEELKAQDMAVRNKTPDLQTQAMQILSGELNMPISSLEIIGKRNEELKIFIERSDSIRKYQNQYFHTFIIIDREALKERRHDKVHYITLDAAGWRVNRDELIGKDLAFKKAKYGKLNPDLYDHLQTRGPDEAVKVAIWMTLDRKSIAQHTEGELKTLIRQDSERIRKFAEPVIRAIEAMNGVVLSINEVLPRVIAQLNRGQIEAIARHENVREIFQVLPEGMATNNDTDRDGMYDNFERMYGLNWELDDSNDDKDNDGISNLTEYHFGVEPNVFNIFYTDVPLQPENAILKPQYIYELRAAVNAVRASVGLREPDWTDLDLSDGAIRAVHIQELRDYLTPALLARGVSVPGWVDSVLTGKVIKGVHLNQIRDAVK